MHDTFFQGAAYTRFPSISSQIRAWIQTLHSQAMMKFNPYTEVGPPGWRWVVRSFVASCHRLMQPPHQASTVAATNKDQRPTSASNGAISMVGSSPWDAATRGLDQLPELQVKHADYSKVFAAWTRRDLAGAML